MTTPMRLWEKGSPIDAVVHRFTVGDDPLWDRRLVHWDCLGSAAHVRVLYAAKLVSKGDRDALLAGLLRIDALDRDGNFQIPVELEDCHSAIEAFLTQHYGEAGQRIHTGRSRNDQVATAMRLFMRNEALTWIDLLRGFIVSVLQRVERDGEAPMPGYTHLRAAMPSSIGLWLLSFAEAAAEQIRAVIDLLSRLDSCPLGVGAGFGVPLPLDRALAAKLLGFSRVQRNPIDVQNSRGRLEIYFVRVAQDIASAIEKLASDLLLFTTAEFGFFELPEAFTTGSSIMPQKRNPDVLELLRARAAQMRSLAAALEAVCSKLPSSYHRDLQLTKAPVIRAAQDVIDLLAIATHVVSEVLLRRDRLAAAMHPDLYAAQAACELVQQGIPFRVAYRRIAERLKEGGFTLAELARWRESSAPRIHDASAALEADLEHEFARAAAIRSRVRQCEAELFTG